MNDYALLLLQLLLMLLCWYGIAKWYLRTTRKQFKEEMLIFYRKAADVETIEHEITVAGQVAAFETSKHIIGDHVKNVVFGLFGQQTAEASQNFKELEDQAVTEANKMLIQTDPKLFIMNKLLSKKPELAELVSSFSQIASQGNDGGGGGQHPGFQP